LNRTSKDFPVTVVRGELELPRWKSEKSSRLLQPALQEALPHNDSSNSLKVQSETDNSIRSSENHDFRREQQEQTLSESSVT
jgi:hypothetical protein